jgi:Cu2+-exporting ATPase
MIEKRIFPVTGMTCASCVLGVEKALAAQPGVEGVNVNLATNTAEVRYNEAQVDDRTLRAAVLAAGYDLIIIADPAQAAATAEAEQQQRYRALRLRTIAAIVLAVPIVIIGMFIMHAPWANVTMWVLATPVVFLLGRQFFVNAWKQARHGQANMDTLVALSTGIAYLFSVFNTLFPAFWTSRGLEPHVYFEPAAVVIAFVLLGKWLEERAKAGTAGAIRRLMGLTPDVVRRIGADGHAHEVPLAEVVVGEVLQVRPGERIAVDGLITEGESHINESAISGESMPVLRNAGSPVLAGTINGQGSFRMRATKVGADTLLARIVRTVQQAQGSKAPVQKLVDRVAAVFVPVVIGIALLSFALWWLLGGTEQLAHGLMAMVTVLVIACPCALGLATPTAIMVGVGRGAEMGILIKDAVSLERAHAITAVVLDKTGTLTEGRPEVVESVGLDPQSMAILHAIASRSEHPLSDAAARHVRERVGGGLAVSDFESITGKGVKATVQGKACLLGSRRLLDEHGVPVPLDRVQATAAWQRAGYTVIWLASEGEAVAAMAIADRIRPSAAPALARLKELGLSVHMQTGDGQRTAKSVADALGITDHRSELLPADKAGYVKQLQARGEVVAMVGDGINDAEALALADVSIAMGKGSDVAMDVAAMTLMRSDLELLPRSIALSRRTVRTIRQNLFWAFIYNVIGIPIAAGVLYPFTGFLLDPMIAGAAMALSSVSVVANSLRLRGAALW